ncbi:TIGR03086 family metal-binding protein [Nocardioides insulae]|uniref:TIGR03086 family metal-binding protein n=1 Tax=Nocardioides insulae TaxID=394734 RepID=UPI0004085512|nr:TIGR03086 family metal-binding protein [Nocardioides insulae]
MSPAEQHEYDAARFAGVASSATAEQWSAPSPVKEWRAVDVVEHLITWLPGFLDRAEVELPEITPAEVAAAPAAAWERRAADVQRLLVEQGDREFESPMFGTTTVAAAVDRFYTADVWMHTWDLGRALGAPVDLGEERCAAALAGMEPLDDVLRQSGQFGPKVEVAREASAQDRLMAFIGRDPGWRPPG